MTTKNNITINKWYDYNFPISNQILLPWLRPHIEFAVKNLYLDILDQIDTDNKVIHERPHLIRVFRKTFKL